MAIVTYVRFYDRVAAHRAQAEISSPSGIFRLVGGVTMQPVTDKPCVSLTESAKYLYFADYYSGTVFRLGKDTGDDRIIVSGLNGLTAVRWADASERLYLLEVSTDANQFKDGTLQVISGPE